MSNIKFEIIHKTYFKVIKGACEIELTQLDSKMAGIACGKTGSFCLLCPVTLGLSMSFYPDFVPILS